jgi:signal transduction histidine kinase
MQQIDFMTRTIEDFRNFFKPSLKQEHFCITESVRDITKLLAPQLKSKEITLEVRDRLGGQMVAGIKNEFDQVVFNLLNNAKEAIIDANAVGEIQISMDADDKNVIFAVRDNGGGVSDEIRTTIFEPYTTSKGESGTGIGLYMAKSIIEEHMNGAITLNNYNGGAVFTITLPIAGANG